MHPAQTIKKSKLIVLKIGSALLVEPGKGGLRRKWLESLADDMAMLKSLGKEIILVSSGAVALGRKQIGLPDGAIKLEEKQAAAAIGQIRLAHAYQELMAKRGIDVAQILLTLEDTENRRRHLNARNTLSALLKMNTLPVINENDTIATEEIRFGDNDRLAARVAAMMGADSLILFSDIDGLYTADPRIDPEAEHLPLIEKLSPAIMAMAGKAPPGYSSGGMITKLEAGRIATSAGCAMLIANGKVLHPIKSLNEGGKASLFLPTITSHTARKNWIAGTVKPKGILTIDEGAIKALKNGRSLLPAGIKSMEGRFERGDAIIIQDAKGNEIARGLSAYDSSDALRLLGRNSKEIETILGYRGRDEIIHRDDLVLSEDHHA